MNGLNFAAARQMVIEKITSFAGNFNEEKVPVELSVGRVLAQSITADRDYPPLDRSIRDGFAVRSADLPGTLEVIGEVRAGETSDQFTGPGQAIEIMTGAPVPAGADAVVMVEHVTRSGKGIRTDRTPRPGEFINPKASECRAGDVVVSAGETITFPRVAMMATVGHSEVSVYRRPRVAIVSTGDEVIPVNGTPLPFQVRNSNASSLAAQVRRAGGEPLVLPVARDEYEHTRSLVEEGLRADLLLLSGGVSAGKYDIVERVLADLGAEFFFTRVLIQPGQPLVFGRARERFFFGLPGNPASTMVTFEIFARAAVEMLAGQKLPALPFFCARLTRDFRHKTGLTRFLPALLANGGMDVTPVPWQGSSDVAALARANAFLVADAAREAWKAGEMVPVLPQ